MSVRAMPRHLGPWLAAPAVVWGAQTAVMWWLESMSCRHAHLFAFRPFAFLFGVFAFGICLRALGVGVNGWRSGDTGSRQYLAAGVALMGVAFALASLWGALPSLFLPLCENAR